MVLSFAFAEQTPYNCLNQATVGHLLLELKAFQDHFFENQLRADHWKVFVNHVKTKISETVASKTIVNLIVKKIANPLRFKTMLEKQANIVYLLEDLNV